jgi:hypothetical protein
MRLMLLAAAGAAILAGPASAQGRHAEDAQRVIDEAVPAMDRATQALLNLDIGPILDAVDPYGPHPHRTLRDMARRDDPDFERNLRASIYGSAASLQRMTAAAVAAEPALRQVMAQFQASIAAAMDAPNAAPPYRGAEPPIAGPMPYGADREDHYPEDEAPPPPEPYDE